MTPELIAKVQPKPNSSLFHRPPTPAQIGPGPSTPSTSSPTLFVFKIASLPLYVLTCRGGHFHSTRLFRVTQVCTLAQCLQSFSCMTPQFPHVAYDTTHALLVASTVTLSRASALELESATLRVPAPFFQCLVVTLSSSDRTHRIKLSVPSFMTVQLGDFYCCLRRRFFPYATFYHERNRFPPLSLPQPSTGVPNFHATVAFHLPDLV